MNKELDLIVFGATSFVGKIICRYLATEYIEPNFSWAMAADLKRNSRDCVQPLAPGRNTFQ